MNDTKTITRVVNIKAGDQSGVRAIDTLGEAWKKMPLDAAPALDFIRKFDKEQNSLAAKYAKAASAAKIAYETRVPSALKAAQKAMREYETALRDVDRAQEAASDSALSFTERAKRAQFSRDNIGDTSTALGSFASVTNAFGGNALGEGLAFGGDIFGAIEYLPNLADSIKAAGLAARDSGGLVGSLATSLQAAIPSLGAAGAGVGALALAAAPFVALGGTLIALVAIVENYNRALADQAKQIVEANRAQRETRREFEQLLGAGDVTGAEERRQSIADEVAFNKQYLDELTAQQEAARKSYEDAALLEIDQRQRARAEFKALGEEISRVQDETAGLERDLYEANKAIMGTAAEAARAENSLKSLADEEAKLTAERDRHAATVAQLVEQENALLSAFEARQAQIESERALQDTRAGEDEDRAAARQAEDLARALERQEAQHQARLVQIEEAGASRIADLRQALVDKTAETYKRIADINRDYLEERARESARFTREQIRREEDFNRERRRAAEDYRASQFEAILENDVGAYLENRRNFRTERARAGEDFEVTNARELEDFQLAQQLAEEKRRVAVEQLELELAAFRAQTAAKIEAETAAIQQRLEAERVAYEETLALDAAQRAIQAQRDAEDDAIRARRQAEDRAIQDQRAREQLNAQLNDINTKRIAEVSALNSVLAATNQVAAAARSVQYSLSGYSSGYNYIRSGGYSGYRDNGGPGMAGGAYMIGTGAQPELFIPRTAGTFIPNADRALGSTNVTVNVGAVGELVTPAQLNAVVETIVTGVEGAIVRARRPAAG